MKKIKERPAGNGTKPPVRRRAVKKYNVHTGWFIQFVNHTEQIVT